MSKENVIIILFFFMVTSNRKIGNAFGMWLGNISYEVYLSHGIVIGFSCIHIPKYAIRFVYLDYGDNNNIA